MTEDEFIVLGNFYSNSPLNKSDSWTMIGHKSPNYYADHVIGDNAIGRLLFYKFIELHWSEGIDGTTQYKISGTGKEAYESDRAKRMKIHDRELQGDRLLLESINSNKWSPRWAGLAALLALVSVVVAISNEKIKPQLQQIDSTLQSQSKELHSVQQNLETFATGLHRLVDSLSKKP